MKLKLIAFFMLCLIIALTSQAALATPEDEIITYEEYRAKQEEELFEVGSYSQIIENYKNGEYGEELYAFVRQAAFGGYSFITVFDKNGVKQMTEYDGDFRFRRRIITDEEYERLVSYIENNDIANLPNLEMQAFDGVWYDYFHLTKSGREYVYINNPQGYEGEYCKEYIGIVNEFENLLKSEDFETSYLLEDCELIVNREDYKVHSVWKDEDDFRILIYDTEMSELLNSKYKWVSLKDGIVENKRVKKPEISNVSTNSIPDEILERLIHSYLNTRPLQPAGEDGKYWALSDKYTIGIIDTETCDFTPLFSSPVPIWSNEHMWIDSDAGIIYIVVNNDLISLPINISATEKPISVFVDGKEIPFDVEPRIEDGRTLVPMRFIFEALGAEVSWDSDKLTAVAVKEGINIRIKIGSRTMNKNGEPVWLDVGAMLENSRTLVPLRAVSEAFGATVSWDGLNRTVTIELANDSL